MHVTEAMDMQLFNRVVLISDTLSFMLSRIMVVILISTLKFMVMQANGGVYSDMQE